MVIHYYAIFDRKAKSFGEPLAFGSPEKDAVTRWFRDLVMSDSKSLLYRYSEDFDLFYLGWFDKTLGEFFPSDEGKEYVVNAAVFFADKEEEALED